MNPLLKCILWSFILVFSASCARVEAQTVASFDPAKSIIKAASPITGSVPRIMSYTPDQGPVAAGSLMLLEGTGFLSTTKVSFGTFIAGIAEDAQAVVYLGPNQLVLVVPSYFAGKADFIVYNSRTEYDYRLQGFTYVDPPRPTPITNPVAEAGDTLGLYSYENELYNLMPAMAESSLDIRFTYGYTRFQGLSPVAGSWDGQPGDTVGYYDGFAHRFHLHTSNAYAREGDIQFDFGDASGRWIPVAGKFAGGSVSTVGLFNAVTQEFRLKYTNSAGPADVTFRFGTGSKYDYPIAGDFNGDGIATVGVYNALTGQVAIRNSNSEGPADVSFTTGGLNSIPVAGDFNRSGRASLGFFDRVTQTFSIRHDLSAGAPDRVIQITPSSFAYSPIAGHWRIPGTPSEDPGYPWPIDTLANQRIAAGPVLNSYLAGNLVPNLRSMLLIRNGKLVAEAYYHGAKASDALDLHSCTKSFTSALYGAALADGSLTLTDLVSPIYRILPQYTPADPLSARNKITPTHLLTMSAGLDWWDDQEHFKVWSSAPDMFRYTLELPALKDNDNEEVVPGSAWRYNSGLTHIAGRILTEVTGKPLDVYAEEKLLEPLGIQAKRWDQDNQGYKFGSGEIFMKPRDMARFGQLYLNRGLVDGKQILPAWWVDATTKKIFSAGSPERPNYGYATSFWTDVIAGHQTYLALGWGGQWILVIPDLKVVMVITSKGDVPGQMDPIQDGLILKLITPIIQAISP